VFDSDAQDLVQGENPILAGTGALVDQFSGKLLALRGL
jgi:hypothetical protein